MTTVVDYSDKWIRSDTGSNIYTKSYNYCSCIKMGSICTVDIAGHVSGTWETGDTPAWVIKNIPKPKNGLIEISGWALRANVAYPIRFALKADGTIKPHWNDRIFSTDDTFSFCVTYITAD